MDNNDFSGIPKPKYVNEYKSFRSVFGVRRGGDKTYLDKLLLQIFVSLIIAAIVLLVNNFNSNMTGLILEKLKSTLEWQVDLADDIKKIGNIENIIPNAKNKLKGILSPAKLEDEFIMPVDGQITSNFGERVHPVFKTIKMHNGIDIDAEIGDEIKAAVSGKVEKVAEDDSFGKYIIISNENIKTIYAHCSKIIAKESSRIKQGDVIAEVGDTGLTSGPHLHFEIWVDEKPIDPMTKFQIKFQ